MAELKDLTEYQEDFENALTDAGFKPSANDSLPTYAGPVTIDWEDAESGDTRTATHMVEIWLPDGFPYKAPFVVVKDLEPLLPSWHLNPSSPQSLCLWSEGNGWKPFHTAHMLLHRIREWFTCYHTGAWPADAEVPDLNRYLPSVAGIIVTGNDWRPDDKKSWGRFALWHSDEVARTPRLLAACSADYPRRTDKPEERLARQLSLADAKRQFTPGIWFRVGQPFVPPHTLGALLVRLDKVLGMENGWARDQFISVFGAKSNQPGLPIALGYHDHRGQERWLFLWAEFSKGTERRFPWSKQHHPPKVSLKSFRSAPASRADLLKRSAYLSIPLQSKKIAIFGVGALGGSVAMLLAKSGIGELRLIDGDDLLPGNVTRHICELFAIGFPKTIAVKHEVLAHVPDCVIHTYDETWKTETLREYIMDCDAVIDTTANLNFSLHLCDVCIHEWRPLITATAHRRARIGRIVIHDKADAPCVVCYLEPERYWAPDDYPIIPPDLSESFLEDGCGAVTEEAVALDVEAVANLVARVSIQTALGKALQGNLAILVNDPLPNSTGILSEIGVHWFSNAAIPGCAACSVQGKL